MGLVQSRFEVTAPELLYLIFPLHPEGAAGAAMSFGYQQLLGPLL